LQLAGRGREQGRKKLLNFLVNTFYTKLVLNVYEKTEKLCHRWKLEGKATMEKLVSIKFQNLSQVLLEKSPVQTFYTERVKLPSN